MSAVPKLRFPEFDGEWCDQKLKENILLISGQHLSPEEYSDNGKFPYFTGPTDFTDDKSKVKKWTATTRSVAPSGSILITVKGSGVGEMAQTKLENVVIGRQLMSIEGDNASTGFLYQYLLKKRQLMKALASGNMIPGLSRADLFSLSVSIPSLPEQQKIASFLSSVDKKIDLLRQKKDALELYKKGLMQKIFSQEIRFKQDDGSDFSDWEEVALGEGLYKPRNVAVANSYGKKITVQLNLGGVTLRQEIRDYEGGEKTKYFERSAGDFIYGKQNFHKGAFGIIPETLGGFYSSSDLPCLSFKGYIFEPKYLLYFLSTFYETFEAFTSGTGSKRLKEETLLGMSFEFPSLAEQEKIASVLSALDAKIQNTSSQIGQMETFKKGLLQQMFV